MSNPKYRITRDFIKQVVHYYNNPPIEVEPKSTVQRKKLHTCKVCTHRFIADLEKTTCPKCSEKEIIIRNEQSTRTQ
jgi:Zn finger protein HypA/HybF involved in hydrogenase expression